MTNKELLHQLWLRQLQVLSVKTLLVREQKDSFSVVPSSNFYWSAKICACEDNPAQRRQIGKLVKAGLLTRWHIHYMQVYFDIDLAKSAFEYARGFWLCRGIPELKNASDVTQTGKVISPELLEMLQAECNQMLVNTFQQFFELG